MNVEDAFVPRTGCPFCRRPGASVLVRVRYRETAEAHPEFPDVEGSVFHCAGCGVGFPSHLYRVEAFPKLYRKSLRDLDAFDRSPLQILRKAFLRAILRDRHRPRSPGRLLDALTLRVLQVPRVGRAPRGLRILDVGSGFGEFSEIYRSLGNKVTGTEIVPELVDLQRSRGLDCRAGELEDLDFGGGRFDVVLLRAVLYRTRDPARTLHRIIDLLAPGGEIVSLDPCPGFEGIGYFPRKQFPQGQFYIVDSGRYLDMLRATFGLECRNALLIYGRPAAPLKPLGWSGHITGLVELLAANILGIKPYVLSYVLRRACARIPGGENSRLP